MQIKPARRALLLSAAVLTVFTACAGSVRDASPPAPSAPGAQTTRTSKPAAPPQTASPATTAHATPQETPAMTTTETDAVANPMLSAEEVGRRFLKLLESLESRGDITAERVQEVMGLTLKKSSNGPFYSQPLSADWFYIVSMKHQKPPGQRVAVSLEFINQTDRFSDTSSICGLSFEDYHNTLKSLGYLDGLKYDESGRLFSVDYLREDFYIEITPELKGFGNGRVYPTCVRRIGLLTPY